MKMQAVYVGVGLGHPFTSSTGSEDLYHRHFLYVFLQNTYRSPSKGDISPLDGKSLIVHTVLVAAASRSFPRFYIPFYSNAIHPPNKVKGRVCLLN